MAECEHVARTTAYFDGALAPADEAAAVDHLATCIACQNVLGDAVAIDAVLSTQPHVQVRAKPARRRWPIVAAFAGAVAIAAATIIVVRRQPAQAPTAVAIALPQERAIEARFSGAQFASHRPLAVLRGDRVTEPIPLEALAKLERGGDPRDLIAALAATGNLTRARELADKLPRDAASDSDRAALALAASDAHAALTHATRALDRAPDSTPALWNFGLAAHALKLERVARTAIAKVEAAGEPGWSAEARTLLAAIDAALAPELEFAAFDRRGRAMVDGGPPITVDDVRRYPAFARVYVLDTLRVAADVAPLRPLAKELDAIGGPPAMTAALERAAAVDPKVRDKLAPAYRAVVARTATPADITKLIADLRSAGPRLADMLAGTVITGSQWAQQLELLEKTVAPWQDPWFDIFVERAKIRATLGSAPGDNRAQPALEALYAKCPPVASLRCGQVAQDIAQVMFETGRAQGAETWALRAVDDYRRAMSPTHINTARALLAQIHRTVGRDELARAELDEVVLATPACALDRYARILAADLALVAGQWDRARSALPDAIAPAGCAVADELQAILTATDLARRTRDASDREVATRWIEAARASADPNGEGIARVGTLRIMPGGDPAPVDAWLADHPSIEDDPRRDNVRTWAVTTLISDAGARSDWAGVVAHARLERPIGEAPCIVVASADDGTITVAAQTPGGVVGAQRRVEPADVASTTIVPPSIATALASCTGIALAAREPLHGRADLLPRALPWWFAGGAPPRVPGTPSHAVEVTSPITPDRDLPALPPPGTSTLPFEQQLTGREATPARVLAALASATYAELHVHGIASARDDGAAYLALSPDADGTFALRARALRATKLARAPLVVLAACRAGAVTSSLRERFSLPDAFLAAGASGVVAVDVPIPDASARAVFDELHRRVAAGEPVERVLAALRERARDPWVQHLMLFR